MILLNNISRQDLEAVASKLLFLVQQSRLDSDLGSISVTISLGVTLSTLGDNLETLVQRADELMYSSKNNGRNRVTIG